MNFYLLALTLLFTHFCFAQEPESSPERKANVEIYNKAHSLLPNNTKEAQKTITPLLAKSLKANDEEFIARSYLIMGLINFHESNYYRSNDYYTKALNSDFAKKNIVFTGDCYTNMGANFIYLNNFEAAIKNLTKSLKINEKLGDSLSYHQILGNIGLLDGQVRNYKEAERKTRIALSYFLRIKDTAQVPRYYQNLAMFYKNQKKLPQALENAYMALRLYKNDDQNIVKVYYIIAETKYKQKDVAGSNAALNKALEIIKASGQQMAILTQIYYQLATNDLSENKFDKIEGYLQKAKKLCIDSGITENMDGYYLAQSEYYARTGNFKAFKTNEEEYLEYMERKDKQQSVERYDELNAFYGMERKEAMLNAQQQELKLKDTQLWGLGLIILILAVASVLISWYYIRMKRYIRSLYISNIEQVATGPFAEIREEGQDRLAALYNALLKLMDEEKLYLQPDLNISELSMRTGSNDKYISQAINTFGNVNFNVFLNKYRINHAKKLIIEANLPLKAVIAESGFNNRTTFYRQFKEITGLTPTQFMDISSRSEEKIHQHTFQST